ncbi:protease inhibitor I42 family protein [Leucobacter sp. HNU]|uniref:protease inhibitor I42 family protein n=1 Tax=Leucobacter sp. HNU TaxID=3236805 RepID=UPI003A7FEA5E
MSRAVRSILAFGAVGMLGGLLTACAPAPKEITIGYRTDSVTVPVGETLVVDFGTINSSVGDQWDITAQPDPDVLVPDTRRVEPEGPPEPIGAPHEFAYRFTARAKGTTTIGFEYRFRGELPSDPAERDAATITVTVR